MQRITNFVKFSAVTKIVTSTTESMVKTAESTVNNSMASYHMALLRFIEEKCDDVVNKHTDVVYRILYAGAFVLGTMALCTIYALLNLLIYFLYNGFTACMIVFGYMLLWQIIYVRKMGKVEMVALAGKVKDKLITKVDETLAKAPHNIFTKTYVSKKEMDSWTDFDE